MVRDACPIERPARTRRELLKMLPLASALALLRPEWRASVIRGGLALSDEVSAAVFLREGQAQTFRDRDVTPFARYPLNSYLTHDPEIDLGEWRLMVAGLVKRPGAYSPDAIGALPRVRQNTRHICIE